MKFTKYNYLSLLFFIIGYAFSLSAQDHNIKEILYNVSDINFALIAIFLSLFFILVIKNLIKNHNHYMFKEGFNKKEKIITGIKTILIGYFIGAITLVGNAVIQVLFVRMFD